MPVPANHAELLVTAAAAIRSKISRPPSVGIVLGSGLGQVADALTDRVEIPWQDVPGWPAATVGDHAGRIVVGSLSDKVVAAMQGRVHLYEGYEAWQVAFPVRALARLGCHSLVLTNAAGGISRELRPGDLMMITDHINLQGTNPCVGANLQDDGDRFFDMSTAYDPRLVETAHAVADELGVPRRSGVYAGLLGPSFETPAEIRMLATLGADAVGMSTVLETIAAVHAGVRVAGISCITNLAAGISETALSHQEVIEVGARARDSLAGLLKGLIAAIPEPEGHDDGC